MKITEPNKLSAMFNEIFLHPGISRQELAKSINISLPTVGSYFKFLDANGLIKEEKLGINNMQVGRKTNGISVVNEAAYAFGMEITRTTIDVVLLDFGCNCIDQLHLNILFETSQAYLKQLGDILSDMISRNNVDVSKVQGVGIAMTTRIQDDNTLSSYNLGIDRFPLEEFTEYIPYPCFIEQISHAPLLNEKIVKGNVTYVWLGEVISGGYASEKGLFSASALPMELNHMCMVRNGRLHICGKRGCLGAYCSSTELTRHYNCDLDAYFDALKANETQASEDMEEYIRILSQAISNIYLTMKCDVILGGPVGARLQDMLPEIKKNIIDINPYCEKVNWLHADQNMKSVVIGCAMQVFHDFIAGIQS